MISSKRQPWWRHAFHVAPGAAALLGVAAGWVLATLVFFPFRDVSTGRLAVLFLAYGLFGGAWGYVFWLLGERTRAERFQAIASAVAGTSIVLLLLAFPGFWRGVGPVGLVFMAGGVCGAAMSVVGAVWGVAHLLDHLTGLSTRARKHQGDSPPDGVWDSELDRGHARG